MKENMRETKVNRKTEEDSSEHMLSSEDAVRILNNVFEACGVPPGKIPFEVLEKRVRERKEGRSIWLS